ncbi:MAG: CPBP family intramembrane glutamic endopeptidase [Planctomycetota bacterium]
MRSKGEEKAESQQSAEKSGSTEWPSVGLGVYFVAYFYATICLLLVVYADSDYGQWKRKITLLHALLALEFPSLLISLKVYWAMRGREKAGVPKRRPELSGVMFSLLSYIPRSCVLWFSFGLIWDWQSVGLASRLNASTVFVVGGMLGLLYRYGWAWVAWKISDQETPEFDTHMYATYRMHLPRGKVAQWLLAVQTVVISPFFEELVYRGFLVFFLASLFPNAGSHGLGAVVGLTLCLLVHIYQGLASLKSHLLAFLIYLVLLYSPLGLLGVIAFHMSCNLFFQVNFYHWWRWHLPQMRSRRVRAE